MENVTLRPIISTYQDPVDFIKSMLEYRRKSEPHFSVLKETQSLRKVSPALISLILKGKRRINPDRADELAKLLNLSASEKFYFKNWLQSLDAGFTEELTTPSAPIRSRKDTGIHLLNDWLNIYVKDLFMIAEIQKNPQLVYEKLSGIAPPPRIKKSMDFLLKYGYLKRTPQGHIVVDTNLDVAESPIPHRKIRQFHKKALSIASHNLEVYSVAERIANTFTLVLDQKQHEELRELITEFVEKLKLFAEKAPENNSHIQLYQLIINLSPTGGQPNDKVTDEN
ncbi:MAG: TIGR02147 family protein [Bdellovibrionaceae bacterium]|nr:TIGR02147 family protein [Pseudobdellovibrionaceae bacterium]